MAKLKAHGLRKKSENELVDTLAELRKELASLRVLQATGSAPNKLARIKIVRKNIARVMTVQTEKVRAEAIAKWANKKLKPKDLRPKLTRAIRRHLTLEQKIKKTPKEYKKLAVLPQRKFALLAEVPMA